MARRPGSSVVRSPTVAFAFALSLVAAGCAAPAPAATSEGAPAAGEVVPSICDAARPAVAYRSGGALVSTTAGTPLPVPCMGRIGFLGTEPTIGVSMKTGHVFYYPALAPQSAFAAARSDDGGVTWTRVAPNLNGQGTHPVSQDPYFYLDPTTNRIFADDLSEGAKCSTLSFSDDEGKTWTNTVAGCTQFDHTSIFAGKPVTSKPAGYPNVVYHCAYQAGFTSLAGFGASCEKSTDGGFAWAPTGAPITAPTMGDGNNGVPLCNAALGHGATGPDGTVYVPHGFCGAPTLAISRDEGTSWTNVKVSDLGMPFDGDNHGHDGAVGVDPAGNVYFGWTARDRMPHLTISRDGGKTWSPAISLAAPGITEIGNFEMAVGGVGKIAFVYMGSTNSKGAPFAESSCTKDPPSCLVGTGPDYSNVSWDGYMGMSVDALSPAPAFFTATINPHRDPLIRGQCGGAGRCQEEYDFLDIRIGPDGTPWAALVDGCVNSCASDPKGVDNAGEGVVGHLVGGPSLLD